MLSIALAEPDAPAMLDALTRAQRVLIPAPTWFEATMVLDRRGDARAGEIFRTIMERIRIEVSPMTQAHAIEARRAWAVFGRDRHRARLNFGDCMVYALAKIEDAPLLCKGDYFALTDLKLVLKP